MQPKPPKTCRHAWQEKSDRWLECEKCGRFTPNPNGPLGDQLYRNEFGRYV